MKNLIKVYLIVFTIALFGCKKTDDIPSTNTEAVEKTTTNYGRSIQQGITVSERGYLVFDSLTALESFQNFLNVSTHAEVQAYLVSINFHSMGESKYDSSGTPITPAQQTDYGLDTNGIVEIMGVIMKPVNNSQFLLTITPAYLNDSSYQDLINGVYDPNTMDKFATFPIVDVNAGLFETIAVTPTGFEENIPFPVPQDSFLGIGWHCSAETTQTTIEDGCVVTRCSGRHRIFGIAHGRVTRRITANSCDL